MLNIPLPWYKKLSRPFYDHKRIITEDKPVRQYFIVQDLEDDIFSYCRAIKGKWWASFLLSNKEVYELYEKLRPLNMGLCITIVTAHPPTEEALFGLIAKERMLNNES